MSSPANPLDIYTTYTSHFELHAHPSWDVLKSLDGADANAITTRFSPNGTLIINTRRDAHQVIDEVKYMATSNMTNTGPLVISHGEVDMVILEPGGFGFMEKLHNLKGQFRFEDFTSLTWVLKPIFVGRKPDNTVEVIQSNLIPMVLQDLSATFDLKGGVYRMKFMINNSLASTRGGSRGPNMSYAFTDKNVAFEANTVEEALQQLQEKLQQNYDEAYRNRYENTGQRKLKYTVNFDPEIKGELDMLLKDSFAPDDSRKFTFDSKKEVSAFILDILTRSQDVNDKIGGSREGLDKQGHPNVWIPSIVPRVCMRDGEVEVAFDVKVYKGQGGPTWTFDYFFADAGKNVDITDFEVVFPGLMNWLAYSTDMSTDRNVNWSAILPTYNQEAYINDSVHEDTTRKFLYSLVPKKSPIEGDVNDVAVLGTIPSSDRYGYNPMVVKDVPSMRLAYNTLSQFNGAVEPQQTFTIRGNSELLDLCCTYPDGSRNMFNTENSIWIKVNIWMMDNGVPRQFFYTGDYLLLTITNIWQQGKFHQQLTVIFKDV